MSQNQTAKKSQAEKAQFQEMEREREHKAREARLHQHRAHLQEQLQIRRDYYSLGITHKLIIVGLFLMLSTFVAFLVLSYFPPTKVKVFELLNHII